MSAAIVSAVALVLAATGLLGWLLPPLAPGAMLLVGVHVLLGIAGLLGFALYLPRHLSSTWRLRAPRSRGSGWLAFAIVALSVACALFAALPRDWLGAKPHRVLTLTHGISSLAFVVFLHRHRYTAPRGVLGRGEVAFSLVVLAGVFIQLTVEKRRAPLPLQSDSLGRFAALRTVAGGPLPVETLAETARCGGCHGDIVAQWSASAHRFASFANPFYLHALRLLENERGREATRFCAGCHDPLPLLAGVFESGMPFSEQMPFADRGVTCLVCHTTVHAGDPRANGAITLGRPPPLFPASGFGGGPGSGAPAPTSGLSDWLVRIDPRAHASRLSSTVLRSPEFCGACHKVGLPAALTGFRFVRGFNDADAWQLSASSHEVALSFGRADEKSCADCHMPRLPSSDPAAKKGTVLDHRFAAANTALAARSGDAAWLAREEEMLRTAKAVAVPLALVWRDQLAAPLGEGSVAPVGEDVTLHVLVTAPGVGHAFPGGTQDSNETWIEVEVKSGKEARQEAGGEARGKAAGDDKTDLWRSGAPDEDGGPSAHAHVLASRPLDGSGEAIVERDAFRTRTVLYNHAATAGAGELVRYGFHVGDGEAGGELSITVRLWFRKFSRAFETAVHRALGEPVRSAQPHILLSERTVRVRVGASLVPGLCDEESKKLLLRYAPSANLQGDVATATEAARAAARCGAGPPAAILEARAALRGNQPARALDLVRPVMALSDGPLATAARMVSAQAHAALGENGPAVALLDGLARLFPRDREVHQLRARLLLRTGRAAEAVVAAGQALTIDPEDAAACYVQMLAAEEAGQLSVARRARRCFEENREDETQRPLRALRRARSTDDDLEAQPIHIHLLSPAKKRAPDGEAKNPN